MLYQLLFLIALWRTSASKELVTLDKSELTKPLVNDDAQKDVAEMEKYFKTYLQFEGTPPASESSDDGHSANEPKVDVTKTPAFMERVLELQREFGMELTGVLDKTLVSNSRRDRCGMTDPPRDPDAPAAYQVKSMWDSKYNTKKRQYHLTYSFNTNTFPPSSKITEAEVKEGVLSAMCMWEWHSNVRFVENVGDNKDSYQADITVGFGSRSHGDRYPFDGQGGTLAHAFYPENGRLHFDSDESWFLSKNDEDDYSKRDIFTVASHELGHNLGLDHSNINSALMAPFYAYRGSFENYKLPDDDKNGMASMYGYHNPLNPERERKTACRELSRLYRVTSALSKTSSGSSSSSSSTTTTTTTRRPVVTRSTLRPTRRTTTTTQKTTTTTTTQPEGKPGCKDDPIMGKNCELWKEMGYCSRKGQAETMSRRCKKSCDLCPGEPTTPTDKEKTIPDTACAIDRFDALTTTYDGGEYYYSYAYKDDYYINTYARLVSNSRYDTYSLLNDTDHLKDSLRWLTNPKEVKPGSRKIEYMFKKTKPKLTAMLQMRGFYLLFDDQGHVDQYTRGGPAIDHVRKHQLSSLFPGFPHVTADAAYVERSYSATNRDSVYILFKGSDMWQYKEKKTTDINDPDSMNIAFEPIPERTAVDISQWHGVPACNVDSVFKYKDVPYFLKGHIFWPATISEDQIGRDFTYHFYRCKSGPPPTHPIPSTCARMSGTRVAGNSAGIIHTSSLFTLFSLILSLLMMEKY